VAAIDLEEESGENDCDAEDGDGSERVVEHQAGDHHGEHLPHRHDDDEGNGSELADGVVNEELATGGADGEDDAVEQEAGVLRHEGEGGVEDSLLEQRDAGQEAREQVYSRHHLYRGHLVLGEQLALPV